MTSSQDMENRERFVIEALVGLLFVLLLVLMVLLVVGVSGKQNSVDVPKVYGTTITNSYNTYNYNTNDNLKEDRGVDRRSETRFVDDYREDYYRDDLDNDGRARVYYYQDYRRDYHRDSLRNYHRDFYMDYHQDRKGDYYDRDYNDYYLYEDYYDEDYGEFYDMAYLDYSSDSKFERYEGIFGNDVDNYEVYVENEEYTGGYFDVTFYFEDYYGRITERTVRNYIQARESKVFFYRDVSPEKYKYSDWWYEINSLTEVPSN